MSDIWKEEDELTKASYIATKLHKEYGNVAQGSASVISIDTREAYRMLLQWPNDEIATRIIKDAVLLIRAYDIDIREIK